MHLLINRARLKNLFRKKFEIMKRSEMVEEYVNEKMDKMEKKKEEFEWCSEWCSGCLEFIIETLTLVAVLKILFFM